MNPASGGHKDIPAGAIQLIAVSGGMQFNQYSSNAWKAITSKFLINVDKLDGYNASTTAVKGTIPVYNASALLPGGITGNATTATKLKEPVTIDIGGIASATGQEFDGSSPITIPITQISINNNNDDAINGVLTKAHGGTGRTDGAAEDVMVNSLSGPVKAEASGQIGKAVGLASKNLDTLIVDGFYVGGGSAKTVEMGYPMDTTAAVTLRVMTADKYVHQLLSLNSDQYWHRYSADSGASWNKWVCVGSASTMSTRVVFVSKSGSDKNTGLESDYPVLTINRAIQVVGTLAAKVPVAAVKLCIGEGDWGSVTFGPAPYSVNIYPFSGTAPTAYSSSLPKFSSITSSGGYVNLFGVVCDFLDCTGTGFVYVSGYYQRLGTIRSRHGSCIEIDGGSTGSYPLEIITRDSHDYVYNAYNCGSIVHLGARTVNVIENLTLTNQFLSCNTCSTISINGAKITKKSGVTVTGKKYQIQKGCIVTGVSIDSLPGTVAGTKEKGAIIEGVPYGTGATDEALMGDREWRPVLLQTGGEASNSLYVRKSNSPNYGLINDGFTLGTNPSSNRYWNLGFYDKNKKALGDILCFHNADSSGGDTAIEFRLLSNDGADFSTVPSMGLVYKKSLNKAYGIAPTPNSDAKSVEIATAAWVRTLLGSYATDADLSKYLPLAGGNMTGVIKSRSNPALEHTSSTVSIGDTSRSSAVNTMLAVDLDKNGKRGGGVELTYSTDGSREIHFTMRNRKDTGWLSMGMKELADGSVAGTLGGKNIVRSINGETAGVDGDVTVDIQPYGEQSIGNGSTGFTMPWNGIVNGVFRGGNKQEFYIYRNGNVAFYAQNPDSGWGSLAMPFCFFAKKGDKVTASNNVWYNVNIARV